MDLYIASTSDGFVLDVRLFASRIAATSVNFPSSFLPLNASHSPLALVLFCIDQEDSLVTAVSSPMACASTAALLFFVQAHLFGFDTALVRSLFTCSMGASIVLNASMTSSPSFANPLGNWRPFS